MAQYEISHIWANNQRHDVISRKRRDAAEYLFRKMARAELVAGWAGLDTSWGWDICRRAAVIAADFCRGVPVGYAASVHNQYGEKLTIRRVA